MPTSRRRTAAAAIVVAICAAVAWYLFGSRPTPEGHPPLGRVTAASLETLRADFNRDADRVRIILLLSPT